MEIKRFIEPEEKPEFTYHLWIALGDTVADLNPLD